jgi:hypothetical protein
MKRIFCVFIALSLSACATCHEHPVACAIGGAIVIGSIAAAAEHSHDQRVAPRALNCHETAQCITR